MRFSPAAFERVRQQPIRCSGLVAVPSSQLVIQVRAQPEEAQTTLVASKLLKRLRSAGGQAATGASEGGLGVR